MKLVNILARELGEWPEGPTHAVAVFHDDKHRVQFCYGEPIEDPYDRDFHTWTILGSIPQASWYTRTGPALISCEPEDRKTAIVTRAQWQAAVEALKAHPASDESPISDGYLPPLKNPLPMPNVLAPKQPDIDWSKAPDWAGAVIKNPSDDHYWVSQFGGISCRQRVGAIEVDDTSACMRDGSLWALVAERPCNPWNGTGLPPVGTKCMLAEPIGNSFLKQFQGLELEVVMHDVSLDGHQIAVFLRCLDPEELSEVEEGEEISGVSYLYHGVVAKMLKPIRTPEQIAAEEREAAVSEMFELMLRNADAAVRSGEEYTALAEYLYDAGYRKQVQP